jgi:DNA-binding response OmpR family regulator
MARILIVDDNASVLQALGYFLELSGHQVELANNGSKALCRALQPGIDLILLDIEMPDVSGIAVCRAIRSNPALRGLPVVMMTGRATSEIVASAMGAGAALVLAKPFDLSDLGAVIRRFVPDPAHAAAPALAAS